MLDLYNNRIVFRYKYRKLVKSINMSANGKEGDGKKKGDKKVDRDLDLANSVRGVWLVKVPKYIR